jgi:hypothetical protein
LTLPNLCRYIHSVLYCPEEGRNNDSQPA